MNSPATSRIGSGGCREPTPFLQQTDFSEPLVRINSHVIDVKALGWSEADAWDGVAEYYKSLAGK